MSSDTSDLFHVFLLCSPGPLLLSSALQEAGACGRSSRESHPVPHGDRSQTIARGWLLRPCAKTAARLFEERLQELNGSGHQGRRSSLHDSLGRLRASSPARPRRATACDSPPDGSEQ